MAYIRIVSYERKPSANVIDAQTHEEVILGALNSCLGFEERETDEQRRGDVQRKLGDEVYRVAPVCL